MSFTLYCPPGITGFTDITGTHYTPDANGFISVPDLGTVQGALEGGVGLFMIPQTIVCTTAKRPTANLQPGMNLLDSTLGKPIWRNSANTQWVDATGSTV